MRKMCFLFGSIRLPKAICSTYVVRTSLWKGKLCPTQRQGLKTGKALPTRHQSCILAHLKAKHKKESKKAYWLTRTNEDMIRALDTYLDGSLKNHLGTEDVFLRGERPLRAEERRPIPQRDRTKAETALKALVLLWM